MFSLLLQQTPVGTMISGYSETEYIPMGAVSEALVPLNPTLSGLCQNWVEAIEKGYHRFFTVDTFTGSTSLIPISSWVVEKDNEMTTSRVVLTDGLGSHVIYPYPDFQGIITILQSNYSASEIPFEYTWPQAQAYADNLLIGVQPYISDYLVAGQPFDSSITTVWDNLKDVSSNYTTPEEAISEMQGGLNGIAISLGQSWPPVDPSTT